MHFIYDNLMAVIVSMSLAMSMLAQQTHVRQETLERQSVYDAKVKALAFSEWLEDDVVQLGARFGRSRERFKDSTVTIAGRPTTRRFEYYYYTSTATATNSVVERVEVRYDLRDAGRVFAGVTDGVSVHIPLYRIVRSRRSGNWRLTTNGTDDWVGADPVWGVPPGYGSPPGLSRFLVEPLDSEGRVAPTPQQADYIRLHFAVVPTMYPLHRARLIPETGLFWGTTIEIRPF